MPREDEDVTGLLVAWSRGQPAADAPLIAIVYEDLRRMARRRLGAERADHTLAPTALVHETYLRLFALRRLRWQNRAQFFAIAARVMRRVLVDHARLHAAAKRGGQASPAPSDDAAGAAQPAPVDLLDLNCALERLAAIDQRLADVVELRYFGGLTVDEAAAALAVSPATVKRHWNQARAWLYRELHRTVSTRSPAEG
jgi:RNA polymerase sigma factor (TIGR02999 family)